MFASHLPYDHLINQTHEQTPLLHHSHPTIALLARQLLTNEPLTSSPDLSLYTLAHFLDRFVYKNPKKAAPRGASAMQPSKASAGGAGGAGVRRVRADVQETPLNVEGWWRRGEGGVPADQVRIAHQNHHAVDMYGGCRYFFSGISRRSMRRNMRGR